MSPDGRPVWVRMVTPLSAGNQNLHAQGGVFTFVGTPIDLQTPTSTLVRLPTDGVVVAIAGANEIVDPMMYRLSVPRSEAGPLLQWLTHERVTGSAFFPGLDGVVRFVRDVARWRKH